jgi:hypothetical protein
MYSPHNLHTDIVIVDGFGVQQCANWPSLLSMTAGSFVSIENSWFPRTIPAFGTNVL